MGPKHQKTRTVTQSHKRSCLNDSAIGRRIRALRKERLLSLEAVASKLGLAYQQVQKYETGANRISCGRLMELAEILNVDVCEFFIPTIGTDVGVSAIDLGIIVQAREIATSFEKIADSDKREDALNFVQRMADAECDV